MLVKFQSSRLSCMLDSIDNIHCGKQRQLYGYFNAGFNLEIVELFQSELVNKQWLLRGIFILLNLTLKKCSFTSLIQDWLLWLKLKLKIGQFQQKKLTIAIFSWSSQYRRVEHYYIQLLRYIIYYFLLLYALVVIAFFYSYQ